MRRRWRRQQAQTIFSGALLVLAVVLSVGIIASRATTWNDNGKFYATIADDVPNDAVLMVNDPAALYYHTGLSGIVVPDAGLDAVQELVTRYAVTHILLDQNRTRPLDDLYTGQVLPDYLQLIPQEVAPDVRVFAVVR